jgi:hypothetical protein
MVFYEGVPSDGGESPVERSGFFTLFSRQVIKETGVQSFSRVSWQSWQSQDPE